MRVRARKREERKQQIIIAMRIATGKNKHHVSSAVKLAKALDMSPSQHFRNIIDELVEEGELISFDVPSKSAVSHRRYYMLPPSKRGNPNKPRSIILKHNGKPVGEMQLPGFETNG